MTLDCFGSVGERLRKFFGVLKPVELGLLANVQPVIDLIGVVEIPALIEVTGASGGGAQTVKFQNNTGFDLLITRLLFEDEVAQNFASIQLCNDLAAPKIIDDIGGTTYLFDPQQPLLLPQGWYFIVNYDSGDGSCILQGVCYKRPSKIPRSVEKLDENYAYDIEVYG